MIPTRNSSLAFLVLGAAAALSSGCGELFDPAPGASITGNVDGHMTPAPDEPLVVQFTERVLRETLVLRVVIANLDAEEDLPDERTPPDREAFEADTLALFEGSRPEAARGGQFAWSENSTGSVLTLVPETAFAIAQPYMVLIEPGLEDLEGHDTRQRIRLPFSYPLAGCAAASLPTGYYFFVLNVDPPPLSTQLQLYAYLDVDAASGQWRAIFTDAARTSALNARPGCPSDCGDNICRLQPLGTSQCVLPSERIGSLDEFRDFLPAPTPPDGFTFEVAGCAADQPDGSTAFGTAPFGIDIQLRSVHVTARDAVVTGLFAPDPAQASRLRARGSIAVGLVQVNGTGTDKTQGTLEAINLFDAEVTEVEAFGTPIPRL